MKRTLYCLVLGLCAISVRAQHSPARTEAFVREVFADQADVLVLQSDSGRRELIEGFLSRVRIEHHPEFHGKKFTLLSTVALQDKFAPSLRRDAVCDPKTFNPLKYNFKMASPKREIYRFDGTDWLIIINPIKR